ncbi:hypothetical protein [Halococcus sp. IIIV-5B]|uniref:hypothetical protein n=1 Tax=Halococcus sp. IIIV-5B TaxID=2321230 RepID=UPI000E738071|nr:hypothetical protein [Halococcus sp. IIIV-5B]RJT07468.1 hypothetical protein D3261_02335 [Halococcus sp. IIIV-5B]
MVKLVLLKRAKEGVDRSELIEYLTTIHGPHNSQLPGVNYTLSVQVDPTEEGEAIPEGTTYYDASETIPVEPEETQYDTLEIHEFDTMEKLIEAHSTEHAQEAEKGLHDVIDFEDEIAFVVRDQELSVAAGN